MKAYEFWSSRHNLALDGPSHSRLRVAPGHGPIAVADRSRRCESQRRTHLLVKGGVQGCGHLILPFLDRRGRPQPPTKSDMINLVPDLPKPKTESASYFVEADPETAGARIVERVMSGMNPLGAFA